MRLPTRTPQQQRTEDARECHDDLYRAYLDPRIGRLYIAASERGVAVDAKKFQDALHRFWGDRGFKLCCETDARGAGFYVWLVAKPVRAEAAA